MDSRSYIKLTGNLTNITGTTGTTGSTVINMLQQSMKTKTVNIGYWNMDASSQNNRVVSTGVPYSKIRDFDAVIVSDENEQFKIHMASSNWEVAGYAKLCCTPTNNAVVEVVRNDAASSRFRSTAFNCDYKNRGWVVVTYSNIQPPSGTTGVAANVLPTTMNVNANVITNNGNDTLTEYGVVYSQSTSTPTISACKVCTTGAIAVGTPYNKTITGLADATTTYFRAYARNCEEVGYGSVCSQLMPAAPPATDVTVYLDIVNSYGQDANGFIHVNETLSTGQYVTVQLSTMQTAENNGDSAAFRVYSASTVGGYFTEIYPISPNPIINYYCASAYGNGSINIYKNSCICWCNAVQSGGGYNPLCSQFVISAIGGSVGIIPHTDYPYMNCVPV